MAALGGISALTQRACGQCERKETVDQKLQNCGRCHFQGYCDRNCQKAHWSEHRKVCLDEDAKPIVSNIQTGSIYPREIEIPYQGQDSGLAKALIFCASSIGGGARNGDPYAQLLQPLVCSESESQAIELLNQMDPEIVPLIIREQFVARSYMKEEREMCLDLLRLSAVQGRFALIAHIFQIIRERNIPYAQNIEADRSGWNLAHFVALHSTEGKFPEIDVPEIHELMDVKNQEGATPQNFVRWLSEPPSQSVAAFGEEKSPLDALEFVQLFGRNYWAYPKITPGALLRTYFDSSNIVHPAYLKSLLNAPINGYIDSLLEGSSVQNIKIRKMEGPNVIASMQGQWECLTARDLEPGDIVAIYSGTIRHLGWDSSAVVSSKAHFINQLFVDADCGGGNLAELINHGFPNCAAYAHCYRGLPFLVMIALEPLKKDTVLYYDYGMQYFKNLGIASTTLNQRDIDDYLKTTQNLRKIPIVEVFPDGFGFFSINRGRAVPKKTDVQATMSQTIASWAHTAKITYLANHHLEEMKKKLDKQTLKLLKTDFSAAP